MSLGWVLEGEWFPRLVEQEQPKQRYAQKVDHTCDTKTQVGIQSEGTVRRFLLEHLEWGSGRGISVTLCSESDINSLIFFSFFSTIATLRGVYSLFFRCY